MAQILKDTSSNLLDSALTGGLFELYDSFGNKVAINVTKFGASAASALIADYLAKQLIPYLNSGNNSFTNDTEKTYLTPLISGAVFVLLNKYVVKDTSQTDMMNFLQQVGATVGSQYLSSPVTKAIQG